MCVLVCLIAAARLSGFFGCDHHSNDVNTKQNNHFVGRFHSTFWIITIDYQASFTHNPQLINSFMIFNWNEFHFSFVELEWCLIVAVRLLDHSLHCLNSYSLFDRNNFPSHFKCVDLIQFDASCFGIRLSVCWIQSTIIS